MAALYCWIWSEHFNSSKNKVSIIWHDDHKDKSTITCTCMYVHVCCTCKYTCIYACTCMLYMYVCMYVCTCILYMYVHMYVCTCMLYMYLYVLHCTYMCLYMHKLYELYVILIYLQWNNLTHHILVPNLDDLHPFVNSSTLLSGALQKKCI